LIANPLIPLRTDLGRLQGLDLHAQYHSTRTGGDFFDALKVGARVAFFLTDIAGTREVADPIAAAAQATFRRKVPELVGALDANLMDATAHLVQELNRALIGASAGVHFAPTFVGCYDLQLGVLAYINAGGQTAILRDSEGTRALPNVSVPMGLFSHFTYEPSMQAFEPGAGLLVVTKGVIERCRGGAVFGRDRVMRILEDSPGGSAAEICQATLQAAHGFEEIPWYSPRRLGFKGSKRQEDLTALAMVRELG
jgi:serine phosphatase RsbU (regulator of sigma subunit)